jgi:hypothetical protein
MDGPIFLRGHLPANNQHRSDDHHQKKRLLCHGKSSLRYAIITNLIR